MKHVVWAVIVLLLVAAAFFVRRGSTDAIEADMAAITRVDVLRAYVTASGEIVATRFADIGSDTMGRLVSLKVREGERVRAGQVVAQIDAVQASSAADSAVASLRALEAEARGVHDRIAAAEADLAAAEARHADASRSLARAKDLRGAGLVPEADLDAAQAAADGAAAEVRSRKSAVSLLEQTRQSAERRVAQGRAEVARAEDVVRKTDITAPIDGVVTRLDVEEGEMVVVGVQNQPGTILMTISDLSAINAEVKVAEADVLRIVVGNPATVTLEALARQQFSGRVVEIGASALPQETAQASAREFRVKVRLEGNVDLLRPGLTCDADILVAERHNVLTAPLQAVVQRPAASGAVETGVFVVTDGVARFTPARTGIIGGLTIEVDEVPEGASIVSGPFQVLREIQDGDTVRPRPSR